MVNSLKKYIVETGIFNDKPVELSEEQFEKFNDYYELLVEWNSFMNLTAITEKQDVCIKHFVDSIYAMKYFDFSDSRICDLGTGAGFPGIPLAILNPSAKFVLVDSLNKRIKFLNEVCDKIGLDNVFSIHGRFEEVIKEDGFREGFDYVVSRAVAPLNILLEYSIPYVKVGGKFISYKSMAADDEIENAKNAMKILDVTLAERYDYELPLNDSTRNLLVFEKQKSTKMKYPRKTGIPKKSPL